ncbi:type IX secretion system plug protein [Sphingobacterium sp. MYb382]|uniref:type IX secretion system plug protein n=1 Tax=Sphingobacterium sp. MYb382 TaxID=2745278 RepID=UPI00309C3906
MKMYHLLKPACFLALMCMVTIAFGQKKKKEKKTFERSPRQELVYANKSYLPAIKTVQFYPSGKESRLPVYALGSADQLLLSFDDLRADVRNYYISIEHCNMDWTPSRTSVLDYVQGFNEDRIDKFTAPMGTLQTYTNYTISFPTENIKPKLAGNYLLKVYEDADKDRLVLTQRFYVMNNLVNVSSTIQQSTQVALRMQNQKMNVTLKTGLTINNPQRDLNVVVKQNQRPDYQMQLQTPSFVAANEFRYNNPETLDFKGNNEFRYIDIRSFRFASDGVSSVTIDSIAHITAQIDEDKTGQTYGGTFDENGRFYIRNRDHEEQQNMGDYAEVTFSLKTEPTINGKIYIVGGFNDYARSPENQLSYNTDLGLWQVKLKLKQGLYDYDYVLEDTNGKVQTDRFSGSHFQTGNDYQILIYNRRMGTYWDELVGFSETSIHNKHN